MEACFLQRTFIGLAYHLRPVRTDDADFVKKAQLTDCKKSFFACGSSCKPLQQNTNDNFSEKSEYWFVLDNKLTGISEELVSIYDIKDKKAKFCHFVIQENAQRAVECLDLICQAAFDSWQLKELHTHWQSSNVLTSILHCEIPEIICVDDYQNKLKFILQKQAQSAFEKYLQLLTEGFEFHHIAVACKNFEKEVQAYKMLGYRQESPDFKDENQGIYGRFLVSINQPRIELLKNSENSHTLDLWLKNKTKMYHTAYMVKNFDKAVEIFLSMGARFVREPLPSTYFKEKICFLLLPNMGLVELIEKESHHD